jgi:hypothetical protein
MRRVGTAVLIVETFEALGASLTAVSWQLLRLLDAARFRRHESIAGGCPGSATIIYATS